MEDKPNRSNYKNRQSMNLVLGEVRLALQIQRERRSSMESKGGILLGFLGGVFALLMGGYSVFSLLPIPSRLFLVAAIFAFVLAIGCLLIVTYPRKLRLDPTPRLFAEKYRFEQFEETAEQLTSTLVCAFENNERIIEGIARALSIAYLSSVIGLFSLALGLLLSVLM